MPIIWKILETTYSSPKEKGTDFYHYFYGKQLWLDSMKEQVWDDNNDEQWGRRVKIW